MISHYYFGIANSSLYESSNVIVPSRSSLSLLGGKYASGSYNISKNNSFGSLSNINGIQTVS